MDTISMVDTVTNGNNSNTRATTMGNNSMVDDVNVYQQ